jgi:hypothetical protein
MRELSRQFSIIYAQHVSNMDLSERASLTMKEL